LIKINFIESIQRAARLAGASVGAMTAVSSVIPPGRKSPFAAVLGLGRRERPGEFVPVPVDRNGLISSLAGGRISD
jgi:hypothetical protein